MALMALQDAAFLLPETREQPMHVGGLQLFQTPDGADRDYLTEIYRQLLAVDTIAPTFRRRAHRSLTTLGQWAWLDDQDIDLEHHVRHSALPRPGRIRELLALTSRLHGTLLDRHRPLWEMHLIEGLDDGRIAGYTKMHHALMDGVSGLRLLQQSLSTDPDDMSPCAMYLEHGTESSGSSTSLIGSLPGLARDAAREIGALGPLVMRTAHRLVQDQAAALPSPAPRTMLNGPITGSRRFAAQSWPIARLKSVAKNGGVTVNDAVLAMCSGALRGYLADLSALPAAPLIAMVPVSLRGTAAAEGGNSVGSILANLATDEADPAKRLDRISSSMHSGKKLLGSMSTLQITALSALANAPIAMSSLFGINRFLPPPFNLVISNIPGPRAPLWMSGSRLDAFYPLSIPTVGQALNITVTSYVDSMEFGLTGCRRYVPHLQRLLTHLGTSLDELEQAVA
jgi:WS/DGAT/MGAT family acyltransferase